MRQDLASWRGQPFSSQDHGSFKLSNLLGKSCLIGIVHTTKNGKTYANISSIMKLPKRMAVPSLVNKLVEFDLGEFDRDVYDGLSQGLRETIALSPEYTQAVGRTSGDDGLDHEAASPGEEMEF